MESLVARWTRLEEEFPALRAEAESRVVRWRWAGIGSAWQQPEPFYHERHDMKPARWFRKPPKKPLGATEYGFDDEDRLTVARTYDAFGRQRRLPEVA